MCEKKLIVKSKFVYNALLRKIKEHNCDLDLKLKEIDYKLNSDELLITMSNINDLLRKIERD